MILTAGINGSGKTTLYYNQIKPFLDKQGINAPFINADEIEKKDKLPNSYAAAKKAAIQRDELIANKKSFVTETVLSHPSKQTKLIDKAQKNDFKVILNHVHINSPDLAVNRVKTRVQRGGHDVPTNKVHARFSRTIENIKTAVKTVDKAYVWDNNKKRSHNEPSHRFVMTLEKGQITKLAPNVPKWTKEIYKEQIEAHTKKNKDIVISKAIKSLKQDSSPEAKKAVAQELKKAKVTELEFKKAVIDRDKKPKPTLKNVKTKNQGQEL